MRERERGGAGRGKHREMRGREKTREEYEREKGRKVSEGEGRGKVMEGGRKTQNIFFVFSFLKLPSYFDRFKEMIKITKQRIFFPLIPNFF